MIARREPFSDNNQSPAILKFRQPSADFSADEKLTLKLWLDRRFLPDSPDLKPRSIKELWTAEKHWRQATGDPDIRDLDREHVLQLRDHLLGTGNHAPATINKIWRTIKSSLQYAADENVIAAVPSIGRRMRSKLVKEPTKRQRPPVTMQELESLLDCCRHATYPQRVQFPAPKLWAAVVLLFYVYGPRTEDFLRWLTFSQNVSFTERLISFEAMKTSKLQGLPFIPVAEKVLRSIRGYSDRVFPGFKTVGCWLNKEQRWKRGYRTTWRSEICARAELSAPIQFKNFRESMITRLNGIEPNLGAWAAGHSIPGVTAQFYDLPTDRIRDGFNQTALSPRVLELLDRYELA